MLNKDAIQEIQNTAVKANGNRIFKPDAEPKHVYLVQGSDGYLEKKYADPEPARHSCHDIRSIVAVVKDNATESSTLWVSTYGVGGLFDDDGRDVANLGLRGSKPIKMLRDWDAKGVGGEYLDQVTVYTLFRSLFRDSLGAHPTIRDDIRKVDISKAQQAAGEVSRTAVSMSKKMIAEASGADKLPEVLVFDVPFWEDAIAPIRVRIRVAFDLDPQQEKFRFIVLPGEIDAACKEAVDWLERQVSEEKIAQGFACPTYRGVAA